MTEGYDDTYSIIQENGQSVSIVSQYENEIERDKFGALKKTIESEVETVKAFPIRLNPTEKQLSEAGIDIKVLLLMYISQKELDLKNISIDVKRDKIRYAGEEYKISTFKDNGHFYDKFRSIILGLNHA